MKLHKEFIRLERYRVAVWRVGRGPRVIAISGGPGMSCDYMRNSLNALGNTREVIFFDQPGCGESDGSAPTTDDTAAVSSTVLLQLSDKKPFTLIAHSWGAYLAARSCVEGGLRPAATVLLNPVPLDREGYDAVGARLGARVAPADMEQIATLSEDGSRNAGMKLMRVARPAYFGRTHDLPNVDFDYSIATFNSVAASLGTFDLWDSLSLMGKLTVLFGDADYIVPDDYARRLPTGAILEVVKSGHFSMIDAAEATMAKIEAVSG